MRDIETISSKALLLQELKRQNAIFNLSDFYLDDKFSSVGDRGAIEIVSSDHDISCFANQSHMLAAKNVFRLLYDDFNGFTSSVWQQDSCDRGNVLFQFCPTSFSLAWIPDSISLYQFRKIAFVSAMFDTINTEMVKNESKVPEAFVKHEVNGQERYISMETNIQGRDGRMLTIDEAMPIIKSRVKSFSRSKVR